MPVKLLPDGTIVFDTVDEALDFRRRSTVAPAAPRRTAKPARKITREATPPLPRATAKLHVSPATRSLMTSIRQLAGDEDVRTEDFARAISVRTTQLPQMFMQLTKELRSIDMTADDVVIRRKIYDKGKAKSVYRAGPRIVEAIRRAEQTDAPLFKESATH